MKRKILHTLRNLCAPALMLGALLAASCTAELSSEVVPGGGSGTAGESEVTLKLQVPATGSGSQTRAVDAATESEVNDLYILAFKRSKHDNSETFDYFVTARKTATTSLSVTEWTANLRVKAEEQTFVMVANAQGTPDKVNEQIAALAANSVGQPKADVLEKLTDALTDAEKTAGFNADATTNHHPFTMYGQTAPVVITANAGIKLDVRMHRIVARVEMTFTGEAAGGKFTPQEVSLYNYNDRARVIPDKLEQTVAGNYETTPTIPAGAVRLPAKVDGTQVVPTYAVNGNQISHQIYLFETAQPTAGTAQEQHVKRPCLIVKGVYENAAKPCYYRIDFAETAADGAKTYMNIVRNHSYAVTVQNVLAPGHDTPEEALTAQAANITATVVQWNDSDIGDIDFDGEHILGIATMKYQIGRKGSGTGTLLQQVKASKGLKWKANLYVMDEHGKVDTNTTPDWIRFVDAGAEKTEMSGTGNKQLQDLEFKIPRIPTGIVERRAVMRFTARNLMVDALVVQDQDAPVYITVKINGKEITEEKFEQLGGWCDEMTIEFGPEGTELNWSYSKQGLELAHTNADGTESTAMSGTTDSGTSEDAQMSWKGNAAELVSGLDYETRTGVLTLVAKGKAGVVAKSVRLFQKKYGVTLDNQTVVCVGQPAVVKVKGNMNWDLEPVTDSGYQEACDNGYIHALPDGIRGYEAEQFYSFDYNWITFQTKTPDSKEPALDMELKFTDRSNGASVVKIVKAQPGIELGGKLYQLFGPFERSITDAEANLPLTDADQPGAAGALMINSAQMWQLYNHSSSGYKELMICSETRGVIKMLLISPAQDGTYNVFDYATDSGWSTSSVKSSTVHEFYLHSVPVATNTTFEYPTNQAHTHCYEFTRQHIGTVRFTNSIYQFVCVRVKPAYYQYRLCIASGYRSGNNIAVNEIPRDNRYFSNGLVGDWDQGGLFASGQTVEVFLRGYTDWNNWGGVYCKTGTVSADKTKKFNTYYVKPIN